MRPNALRDVPALADFLRQEPAGIYEKGYDHYSLDVQPKARAA